MKKLIFMLIIISFLFSSCGRNPPADGKEALSPQSQEQEEDPGSSEAGNSAALYSEASQKLISRREAVLKMLAETPDPLSRIENPSHNAPLETVYDENCANGIPKFVYDFVYAYYNAFVTLEPPELASLGGNTELGQELRLRVAKLRRKNIVLKSFAVELHPYEMDINDAKTYFGGLLKCSVSWEAEGKGSGKEVVLLSLSAFHEDGETTVEGFGTMQLGCGGVYSLLDTEFAEVTGRWPEFAGDSEKIASAGICEYVLG